MPAAAAAHAAEAPPLPMPMAVAQIRGAVHVHRAKSDTHVRVQDSHPISVATQSEEGQAGADRKLLQMQSDQRPAQVATEAHRMLRHAQAAPIPLLRAPAVTWQPRLLPPPARDSTAQARTSRV